MKKQKIYIFEAENWERKFLVPLFKGQSLEFVTGKLTPRTAKKYKEAEIVSTFIYSEVNQAAIKELPRLKLVATRSTGYDHIDLAACRQRGVKVANVPNYGENTVAEHTFALLLALSRKIYQAYDKALKLDFDFHGLRGWDLMGKTLGIVGFGKQKGSM